MPKSIEEILNETLAPELKASLKEAIDAKVASMRVEIEESVGSDMAERYEHDRASLVEAMDKMLSDVVRVHEEAKAAEIAKLAESRAKYEAAIVENKTNARAKITSMVSAATKMISESVATEVKALRDQKIAIADEASVLSESVETIKAELLENHEKHIAKINEFVTSQISKELKEFEQDKRALVETRAKLLGENKKKLAETQNRFIKEAAKKVDMAVNATLNREMKQLHEDVERYRQNEFGRELFEAFASTYMTSHLSEGSAVRKLQKVLESKEAEIANTKQEADAAKARLDEAVNAIRTAERRTVVLEERMQRNKIMSDLLSNLRGEKRGLMEGMLETTKTANLKAAFDRLLPVVLNESTKKTAPTGKTVLSETKTAPAITGDRQVRVETATDEDKSIAEILHLAGIRK
jgi:hypothetical protein